MFGFLKKIFGLPTAEEVKAAQQAAQAPYKIEPPTPAEKETVTEEVVIETKPAMVESTSNTEGSIAPAKKPRKPRAPKVVGVKEKAAKATKPAAKKPGPRSKKA